MWLHLTFAILLLAATTAEENGDGSCTPGTKWKKDCNECRCTDSGEVECDQWICLEVEPEQNQETAEVENDGIPLAAAPCHPGNRWKVDCNHCFCTERRVAVCTKRGCRPETRPGETGSCLPGSRWKMDCNDCWCTETRVAMCTRRGCLKRPSADQEHSQTPGNDRPCIPGRKWKIECNDCWCTDDGDTMCTRRGCLDGPIKGRTGRISQAAQEEKKCVPGTEWKEDCNDCRCNDMGLALCTYRGCLSLPPLERDLRQCIPGNRWTTECNSCWCTDNATIVCTRVECAPRSGPPPTGEGGKCIPGARWKDNCNDCFCRQSGIGVCTYRGCLPASLLVDTEDDKCLPGARWKEDCSDCHCDDNGKVQCISGDCPTPDAQPECAPGSTWKEDCNTCICNELGLALCTYKGCLPGPSIPEGSKCVPGARWKKDCNDCFCTGAGVAACTLRGCQEQAIPLPLPVAPPAGNCTPGEAWREDCNHCRCTSTGLSICTRRACSEAENTARTALVAEAPCTPGDRWNDGCNDCWCTDASVTMCTRRACLPRQRATRMRSPPSSDTCKPGEQWNDGCNDCWCTDDGKSMCTRKACLPNPNHPDSKCTPGTRYRDECNDCVCTADNTAMCTRKACRPGQMTETAASSNTCLPGARWTNDCNRCMCTEDKIPVCTRRACLPVEDTTQQINPPSSESCTPGDRWNDGCNDCWCTEDSTTMCTRRACLPNPQMKEESCISGEKWNDGCNDCWCTDDGTTMCTRKACSPGETTGIQRFPPSTEPCTPGDKWNDGCNDCWCTNDSIAICTRRGCLPVKASPAPTCNAGDKWNDGCNDCWCTEDSITMCTRRACRPDTETEKVQYDPVCYEPPVKGKMSCLAFIPSWTFNSTSGQCQRYVYGGCAGTENLFQTEDECRKKCLPSALRKTRDVCSLPLAVGPCRGRKPVYGYNQLSQRCELFFYGGCQGNDNRFQTPGECRQTCGGATPNTDPSCKSDKCDWISWTHYQAKKCKPVYENNSCCPASFDCSEWDRVNTPDKCFYDGRLYAMGAEIPEVSEKYPCRLYCRCIAGYNDRAIINCVNVECPEDLGSYHGCERFYHHEQCCAVNVTCPVPPTVPGPPGTNPEASQESQESQESEKIKDEFMCHYHGQLYNLGELFYPEEAPCKKCICDSNWNGQLTGPVCQEINCGLELYSDKLSRNCVPLYFPGRCCPIDFVCPDDHEETPGCDDYDCPDGEECYLMEVQCVAAPCPLIPACRPTPDKEKTTSCGDHDCPEGEECYLREVQCVTAPCPPVPSCRPRQETPSCEDHECPDGEECYLREVQCVTVPCPPLPACRPAVQDSGCDLFRCPEGQECYVQEVQCIREPCPKTPACRPEGIASEPKCIFGGDVYKIGERIDTEDPCNHCTCRTPPSLTCVKLSCSTPPRPPNGASCAVTEDSGQCCPQVTCAEKLPDEVPPATTEENPCADFKCDNGEVCLARAVQCIAAPCPPEPECVPSAGTACDDYKCDGECYLKQDSLGAEQIPDCIPKAISLCAVPDCPGCLSVTGPDGCPTCDCSNLEKENPCDSNPCAEGAMCKREEDGLGFVCFEPLTCDNLECPDGERCEMKEVQCVAPPCLPTPECVPE